MSKISNYITVYKDFGNVIDIEINISLHTSNCEYGNLVTKRTNLMTKANCLGPSILKEVASALGGVGGSFFGSVLASMVGC
jgi:hypothetical protein